jgi:hypothetical protein
MSQVQSKERKKKLYAHEGDNKITTKIKATTTLKRHQKQAL